MKTKITLFILSISFLLVSCNTRTKGPGKCLLAHSDTIKISGAFALAPMVKVWIAGYQKIHPDIKFFINPNGSGGGLHDVLGSGVDIAMISEEVPRGVDTLLWIAPVARLGVVPVISAKNPYLKELRETGISRDDLVDLFSGENSKTWGEIAGKGKKDPVQVYLRGDSSGATTIFARYLWLDANEIKGTAIRGEDKLIEEVKKNPLALSYCNFIYAFNPKNKVFLDDLTVLPINFSGKGKLEGMSKVFDSYDHLQRAMWLGKFPCSLIRNLYLVTKGKPKTKEMVDFIYWVVTDGQRIVPENGYIELYSSEVQYMVNAMKVMAE